MRHPSPVIRYASSFTSSAKLENNTRYSLEISLSDTGQTQSWLLSKISASMASIPWPVISGSWSDIGQVLRVGSSCRGRQSRGGGGLSWLRSSCWGHTPASSSTDHTWNTYWRNLKEKNTESYPFASIAFIVGARLKVFHIGKVAWSEGILTLWAHTSQRSLEWG